MMVESKLEIIMGTLSSAAEFVEGSWSSSAEVTKKRITDTFSRGDWFHVNNFGLCVTEENDAILYLGSKDNSSLLDKKTIENASECLTSSCGYKFSEEIIERAKQNSLRIRISELELKFDETRSGIGYFPIDTSDLTGSELNEAQRKFAEVAYGSMKLDGNYESDYSRAMKMFNKGGIKETRIYVPRKETVLRDTKEGAIVMSCWLNDFSNNSTFCVGGDVTSYGALCGQHESAKPTDGRYRAYQTLLNAPPESREQITSQMIKMLRS